jgi:hypothetical protein
MGQVSRYDYGQVTKSEITDEGYLKVWCKAARVGTQLYTRGDGTQVREYRPEDEVSNPDSLASFGMKAVTLNHPKVLLDSKTTKLHQVGHAGSHVRFSDGFVEVALVITDQDAIDAVQRGDAQEVSAGYRVDYEAQDRIDASQERIAELEKQLAEAVAASEQRDDAAEINDAVNKRLEALNKFAPIMPEDYKFDGEDEAQIMAIAYQNVFEKEARSDASADYLLGVLDGVLAAMEDIEEDQEEVKADSEFVPEEDGSNVAEVRAAIAQVQASEKFDAKDSYRERLVNGWKSDLSANA